MEPAAAAASAVVPALETGDTLSPIMVPTASAAGLCSEHVRKVEPDSEEVAGINEMLEKSFLDEKFECRWKPACFHQVENKTLQADFDEKKQDLLIRGRKPSELEEYYGFFVDNNPAAVDLICSIGVQARDSEYNALGYNRMGIYVCKHADVCLQHALVKYSGSPCIRLVVCKYLMGRHTKAIPRVASASEFIEPTQGFDSHVSVIPPSSQDSLQNQFDRSQVFLFEINKLLQPSIRPRQLLPLAVVSFTQNGEYHPSVDAEATSAEKLANNPRLQHIINAINSKDEVGSPGPPGSAGSSPPAPASPASATPPAMQQPQLSVTPEVTTVIQQINAKLDGSHDFRPRELPASSSSPFPHHSLLSPAAAQPPPMAPVPISLPQMSFLGGNPMPAPASLMGNMNFLKGLPSMQSMPSMQTLPAGSLLGSPYPFASARTLPQMTTRSLTPEMAAAMSHAAYFPNSTAGLMGAASPLAASSVPSSLMSAAPMLPATAAAPFMYHAMDTSAQLLMKPMLYSQPAAPVLNTLKRPLQSSDLVPDKRVKYY